MTPTNTNKQTYTFHEAARLLELSSSDMNYWMRTGILKGERINGRWLFTLEALQEFCAPMHPDYCPHCRRGPEYRLQAELTASHESKETHK